MRTDLTSAFITAKNASFRAPRLVAVFYFPVAGIFCIGGSEPSTITIDSTSYPISPIVEDWGELADAGDAESFVNSEVRQMTLTIWNGGSDPFSNLFLQEDPEDVEVDLYLNFLGIDDSDKSLIDRFVVQDPIEFDEASRLLRLDMVSISMRYDGKIGPMLLTEDWPNAKSDDVGKGIDLIVGSPGAVKTLCAKTSATASLASSIIATTTNIEVNEDLDEAVWPSSGTFTIDEEEIYYPSRTTNTFENCTRGHNGTAAVAHAENATITEEITDHTYLVGQGPVTSISNLRVAGQIAPASWYTTYPALDPARIVFNRKPTYLDYSNSKQDDIEFDDIGAANTAIQPYYAFLKESRSSSATLRSGNSVLSIVQTDSAEDVGNISRVFLYAQHWASRSYDNEIVTVWVEGIGDIGTLTRPSAADDFAVAGDVDIDHPHDNQDPGLDTDDDGHDHITGATAGYAENGDPSDFSHGIGSGGAYGATKETTIWFNDLEATALSSTISINTSTVWSGSVARIDFIEIETEWGGTVTLDNFDPYVGAVGTITVSGGSWPRVADNQNYWVKIRTGLYVNDGTITVYYQTPLISYNSLIEQVESNETGVISYVAVPGEVEDLATDNRPINVTSSAAATRDITDYFDVTDHAPDISWDWFQGREVRFTLSGSTPPGKDPVEVYITYTAIEVDYKERRVLASDDVTCDVVGSLPVNPASFASYLLTNKASLPGTRYDSTSWAAAIDEYDTLGYTFDGLLSADLSVREALKKVVRQARGRIIWSGGLVKFRVRQELADWLPARHLTSSDYQLKSIKARRQRVTDIVNAIDLAYRRDYTQDDEDTGYRAITSCENAASIAKHGRLEQRENFRFDLVSDSAMAADLADFYIDQLANPSTFIELISYLPQFDMEKEDIVELSANFNRMSKMPGVIRSSDFLPGSGKNKRITMIRFLIENLRYILLEYGLEDQVSVLDSLDVETGSTIDLSDVIYAAELLSTEIGKGQEDMIYVADILGIIMSWLCEVDDTVQVSDELSALLEMQVNDEVYVADEAFGLLGLSSYGAGPYGQTPYGGFFMQDQQYDDTLQIIDELGAHVEIFIDENIVVTDEMIALDELSYGYGAYGQAPYGGSE